MPQAPEVAEKTKHNVLILHYDCPVNRGLTEEIERTEQYLKQLKKEANPPVSIYLPSVHPIFPTGILKENIVIEWTTTKRDGGQTRELVYTEKIVGNPDYKVMIDNEGKQLMDFMDFSNQHYIRIDGVYYGKKGIPRLTGQKAKSSE